MNIKYNFLIVFDDGHMLRKSIISSELSYKQLAKLLYRKFRNFYKLYSEEINSSNISKYILDSITITINSDSSYKKEYFVYISIDIRNYIANITISNKDNSYIYEYKKVVINDKYAKNCVTDFINRGIQPINEEINKYSKNINSRHDNRMNLINYHSSDIYERDYTQITKIKELAEKMVNLCNKELIQISNKYIE